MIHPKEIDVFAAHAHEFIAWCESDRRGKTSEQLQRESLKQLSCLYAAALDLPRVDFKEAPDPPSQDQAVRQRLAANLKALPFQYYWEVFTPTNELDHEPVTGDLFDDLLDIYGDIADGWWLYERQHFEAAVRNVRYLRAATPIDGGNEQSNRSLPVANQRFAQ